MANPVIVLEFNELTPRLMDAFIAEGKLPGFKRLHDQSLVCVSDAGEAPPALEPWIQWVTVHTGLPFAEHKVFALNDGPKYKGPRIWDRLSDAGRRVWVCGSMNAAVQNPDLNGYVLPDPWAADVLATPDSYFRPYLHLVKSYVQEYTSDKPPVSRGDFLNFARFMAANGLSVKTVLATLRQLAGEGGGQTKWKRATILDRLQWDMFRVNYKRLRPAFSTFFLNSTAHFQHYYWRNMEPERFGLKPTDEQQAAYKEAILHGYQSMDAIVSECLDLAGPDATVVLCTALGQQPLTRYEEEGGKQVFRARDVHELARFAGVSDPYEYRPVMAEEFQLRFADADAAAAAEAALAALSVDGAPLMRLRREGATLFAGCGVYAPPPEGAQVRKAGSPEACAFSELFYLLEGLKSGGHHPDGILWIRTAGQRPRVVERKVALTEVAPTLYALCGLDPRGVFPGRPMPEVDLAASSAQASGQLRAAKAAARGRARRVRFAAHRCTGLSTPR